MTGLGCLLNPVGCFTTGLDTWVHAHILWVLLSTFAAGMIVGAWMGKLGVFAAIGAVVVAVLLSRRGSSDYPSDVDGEDARPSHPKPPRPIPSDPFAQERRKKH